MNARAKRWTAIVAMCLFAMAAAHEAGLLHALHAAEESGEQTCSLCLLFSALALPALALALAAVAIAHSPAPVTRLVPQRRWHRQSRCVRGPPSRHHRLRTFPINL